MRFRRSPLPCVPGCGGLHRAALLLLLATLACSAPRPAGEQAERDRIERAGQAFAVPHADRELPTLPVEATLEDVLRYAFLSNASIERAWAEWRMAVERVPQAVSADDPTVSFEYLFSREDMTRWDRTTLSLSQRVPFPGKLELAGQIALNQAVATGHRFEDAKFSLQADVVAAFSDLALADQRISIAEDNLALLRDFAEIVRGQVATGGMSQAEASKAELEIGTAENDLAMRRAERAPMLAMLNALLSRSPDAPLVAQTTATAVPLPADDAQLLALAGQRNPELAALAAEVRGNAGALELAGKAWLPDFDLGALLTGNMERMLMAAIDVPIRRDRIEAGIAEARAGVQAAQAALRAHQDDVGAQVVLQLFLARDSDRQVRLLADTLVPRAREVVDALRGAYSTGGSFLDLLDAQRTLLDLRLMEADVQATRAKGIARLEALCALDFGTLAAANGGAR